MTEPKGYEPIDIESQYLQLGLKNSATYVSQIGYIYDDFMKDPEANIHLFVKKLSAYTAEIVAALEKRILELESKQ